MNRLTAEQAERIRARALVEPNSVADPLVERLQERISSYRETLWFFETWIAFLEARLKLAGIDPMDMWESA
jgi:hypothetical protein